MWLTASSDPTSPMSLPLLVLCPRNKELLIVWQAHLKIPCPCDMSVQKPPLPRSLSQYLIPTTQMSINHSLLCRHLASFTGGTHPSPAIHHLYVCLLPDCEVLEDRDLDQFCPCVPSMNSSHFELGSSCLLTALQFNEQHCVCVCLFCGVFFWGGAHLSS